MFPIWNNPSQVWLVRGHMNDAAFRSVFDLPSPSCASLPRPILHGKEIILCRFFSAANVFGRQSSFLWWFKCKIGIVGKESHLKGGTKMRWTQAQNIFDLIQFFSDADIFKSLQLYNYSNLLNQKLWYCKTSEELNKEILINFNQKYKCYNIKNLQK